MSTVPIATPAVVHRRPRLTIQGKQALFGYLAILPTLLIFTIFRFAPMAQAFVLSFTKYDLVHAPKFIGVDNFVNLLHDALFLQAARISITYVVLSCIPVWLCSLGLATLFNRAIVGKNLFRSVVFLPVVMPIVVVAVIWTFIYHQDGILNSLIGLVGLKPIPWIRSSGTALWSVIMIGVWRATPYYMVIFLAGLQAIPSEYYEAAQIDGASAWSAFRHITLPLLRPTTLLVMVMSIIVAMKVFAIPLIMTEGGPAGSTRVLPLFIYQTAFVFFNMGYAAAASLFLFGAVMLFSVVQIRIFRQGEE
jgi:multiple sugar transport system permease protein